MCIDVTCMLIVSSKCINFPGFMNNNNNNEHICIAQNKNPQMR